MQVNYVDVNRRDLGQQARLEPQSVDGYGDCWRPATSVKSTTTVLRLSSVPGQDSVVSCLFWLFIVSRLIRSSEFLAASSFFGSSLTSSSPRLLVVV